VYTCTFCGELSAAHAVAHSVVVERRLVSHPPRKHAQRPTGASKRGDKRDHYKDDPGGTGWQIVRAVVACARCAAAHDDDATQRRVVTTSPLRAVAA
jgi:hypothetical protein